MIDNPEEIIDYKIVSHNFVNEWLSKGYRLYGNPFSVLKSSRSLDDPYNETIEHVNSYKQAVIKYKY